MSIHKSNKDRDELEKEYEKMHDAIVTGEYDRDVAIKILTNIATSYSHQRELNARIDELVYAKDAEYDPNVLDERIVKLGQLKLKLQSQEREQDVI